MSTSKFSRFHGTAPIGVKSEATGKYYIDYKQAEELKRLISANGKILARSRSRLTAMQQRQVSVAIKRARFMALLPYVAEQK